MLIVKIKNNDNINHTWCGQEIIPEEYYTVEADKILMWATDSQLLTDIGNELAVVNDGTNDLLDINGAISYLKNTIPTSVNPTSDFVCQWTCMKNFLATNPLATLNYFETPLYYYLWISFRDQKFYIPQLTKSTDDCTDFETNYKAIANTQEAPKVRITTCKLGRKLHSRYVSFTTSDQDNFDNTDWNEEDYGDIVYKMYKWVNDERVLTTTGTEAEETWIDFEPEWSYEICSGSVTIPDSLTGEEQNLWELHVIAVPDVPEIYGGSVNFIANPKLKFNTGETIGIDSSMHPAELLHSDTYHTNKLRFIFKHPAGAQSEFQIQFKLYR